MKFANFKKDERCKKLERSLKLALLRSCGNITSEGPATPISIRTSISSINTDAQDLNCTTSSLQISEIENEVVSSSNNLRSIMPKKKSKYTILEPTAASSSIKRSSMEMSYFNRKTASPLFNVDGFHERSNANSKIVGRDLLKNDDYSLPQMEKSSCLQSINKESVSNSINRSKLRNANTQNDNNNDDEDDCSSQLVISNITNRRGRTFSNWRVMLNEDGQLLVKGTLESGKVARSKPILTRLTATRVQSIFKHTYYLEGSIVDNRCELPEYVRGKFYSGFPDDWENVHQVWKLYVSQGTNISFHWPTKITDSDDDINSEVTDVTFLHTKKDENWHSKSGDSKVQIPDVLNVQTPFNGVRSNDWKKQTSEAKPDNTSNTKIEVPGSRNISISSTTKKIYDCMIWDKENKNQHENINMHMLPLQRKENTMKDIIQKDKINIIVNNLLRKDCPKEYILKIIQMFDCLDDVFSYRIGTDKANYESSVNEELSTVVAKTDGKESGFYGEQVQGKEFEINSQKVSISPAKEYVHRNKYNRNVHKISSRIFQEQAEDFCIVPEKVNDVQKLETKDADESRTYMGVPKIISDRILENTKKYSLKRDKRKQERETADVNSRTRNDLMSKKKFTKETIPIDCSSLSDDDIGNDKEYFTHKGKRKGGRENKTTKAHRSLLNHRESSGNVHYDSSVSITEDEELRLEEKFDRTRVCERKVRNSLKYNHIRDVSSTDDEIELPKPKHQNTREAIKHSAKKPKIVKNNDDVVDHVADTSNKIDVNNVRIACSGIAKRDTFKNSYTINANKDITNVESKFASSLSNRNDRNNDTRKSRLDNTPCVNDDHINEYENSSKVCKIPRGYEFRGESEKDLENVKSPVYEIVTTHDGKIPDCKKAIGTSKADNTTLSRTIDSSVNDFEKTEKFKLLSAWVPRIVYDPKSICKLGLVFEGKLLNEAGHVVNRKFVTDCIRKRISSTLIETTNREIYRLVGNINDPKHVVPKEILRHCYNGCPSDINEFCKIWRSLQEDDASKAVSKQENATATGILSSPRSSKGRMRFPSLNYWAGERIAVKDDKIVYAAGDCNSLSSYPPTDNTKDQSSLQERNKLNEHPKNVEAMRANTANEKTTYVLNYTHTMAEKAHMEEECHRFKVPLRKNESTMLPNSEQRVDKRKKSHMASRDDDQTQLDGRKKKYSMRQQSPIKKQNLRYTYYRNIPRTEDILSDDQISQL